MKGIITEIERFALKDGPGIRTTVFFKGCNMACKWCHNPETLSVRPQLMIYPDKCIGLRRELLLRCSRHVRKGDDR